MLAASGFNSSDDLTHALFPPVPPAPRWPRPQLRLGNMVEVSALPPRRRPAKASETLRPTPRHRQFEGRGGWAGSLVGCSRLVMVRKIGDAEAWDEAFRWL